MLPRSESKFSIAVTHCLELHNNIITPLATVKNCRLYIYMSPTYKFVLSIYTGNLYSLHFLQYSCLPGLLRLAPINVWRTCARDTVNLSVCIIGLFITNSQQVIFPDNTSFKNSGII